MTRLRIAWIGGGFLLAVLIGLVVLNQVGDDEPAASASAEDGATEAADASNATGANASAAAGMQRCSNEARGYAISFPADWHTNAEVRQEFDVPTPACTYFGADPIMLRPNAGLPASVSISIERWTELPMPGEGWETRDRRDVTIAGRPAVVVEEEQTSDAGAPFSFPGDRMYAYHVELPDGSILVAGTGSTGTDAHERNRAVLDAMMVTLELTGGGEPRQPERPLGP